MHTMLAAGGAIYIQENIAHSTVISTVQTLNGDDEVARKSKSIFEEVGVYN